LKPPPSSLLCSILLFAHTLPKFNSKRPLKNDGTGRRSVCAAKYFGEGNFLIAISLSQWKPEIKPFERLIFPTKYVIPKSWKSLPSRERTYPTWGKGKSSTKCHFLGGYVSSLEGKV